MEAFGRVHPSQRRFGQCGMLYNTPGGWNLDDVCRSLEHVRTLSGMDYLLTLHGDATYSLPDKMADRESLRVAAVADALKEMTLVVDLELPRAEMMKTVRAGRAVLRPLLDARNCGAREVATDKPVHRQ